MIIELKQPEPFQTTFQQFQSSLRNLNQEISRLISSYDGKLVKQNDYYYLVSFQSVSGAVHAAFKIQSVFHIHADVDLKNKITLKIGLSAGVPVTEKQLLFEDTIKIADRMCQVIRGEIIVTSDVKHLYESENANTFHENENVISLTKEDEKFIAAFMDHMDSVWNDANLKVDDFNRPVGHSKSQLYRKMMSLTGKSPKYFYKRLQVE
jgi:hypothetical protein